MKTKPKQPGAAKLKKRAGAKKKFDPKDQATLRKIEKLAAGQMLEKDIAYCMGIHPTYFADLKALHPELSDAIKKGTAKGLEIATQTMLNAMKKKNLSATMFYLKCKGGWRENGPADNKGNDQESTQSAIQAALQRVTG